MEMEASLVVFVTETRGNATQDKGQKEMFYLTTHSTHFIYGYMASGHSDSER